MKKIILCFFILLTTFIAGCQFPTGGNGNNNNNNGNDDETPVESKISVDVPSYFVAGKDYVIEPVTDGVENDEYDFEVSDLEIVELNDNVLTAKFAGTFELTIISKTLEDEKLVLTINIVDNRIFKITYYKSGGELLNPVETFTTKDVIELPIPTKEDYIFEGWFLSENLQGDPITEIDGKIAEDVSVYAKWVLDDGSTEASRAVVDAIKNLPLVIKLVDKNEVERIRASYDSLTDKEKATVVNYQKLVNAETKIRIEVAKYQNIIDLINEIPENVTLSASGKIIQAEKMYEALNDDYKAYVTNIDKLITAREKLNELMDSIDFNINDYIPEYINQDIYAPSTLGTKQLTWSVIDSSLLVHSNDYFTINKVYQNHQEQHVTVSVVLNDGVDSITLTKEVVVAPIVYEELTSTPVAAYVNSGAMYHYVQYNGRDEVFSAEAKELLDIVYYCFVNPTSSGSVTITDTFLKYYDEVIELKKYGVRVVVSVAGSTQAFSDACANDSTREKLASELVKVVQEYNFDGVDLDWEFPGTGSRDTAIDKANYTKLFKSIREKFDAIQASGGTNYLLSSAVPSTSWGTNRYDFPGMNKYLDYVNMMSYDLNRTDKTTHISGLYTSQNDGGYGFSVQYGINRFTSLGLDKSKIIIGCACYGKTYKLTGAVSSSSAYPGLNVSATLTQITGVTGSHASGTIYYYGIEELIKTGKYTKYIEKLSNGNICGSYLYNSTDKIFISYESPEVIAAKYNFAVINGVGIMCWSMPEDASDVYINTIYDIRYGK